MFIDFFSFLNLKGFNNGLTQILHALDKKPPIQVNYVQLSLLDDAERIKQDRRKIRNDFNIAFKKLIRND